MFSLFNTVIIQPVFNVLLAIYSVIPGHDFGVAIIIFTLLVRLALWPLAKKQLHQTKAMQKMQPDLVRIKKEAKGNKQMESMMMLELYKKHDISPFRSIGILLIQLPIFIALYQVINIFLSHKNIDSLTYGFLKGFGPVKDMIADPTAFGPKLFGIVDLTKNALSTHPVQIVLMLLVIAAAVTQYFMTKQLSPKGKDKKRIRDILKEASEGKQANQSEMNAAMMGSTTKFLPILMFFIMVGLPGAIVLYYLVTNLVAVVQQHYVLREDTEEMIEIADKATEQPTFKKATARAREKVAQEGHIIRIKANDTAPDKFKRKDK
jgi:YidC/Oxa1 family membrane protein insertase